MKRPAKILVITNGYPNRYKPYAGMYLKRHVQLHQESGLTVTVLSPGDSRHGIFRSSWKYTRLFLQTLKAWVWADFDLVHAHWELPAGLLGLIVSRLRRKPFVLTSHGAYTDNFASRPWGIRQLVRLVLRGANQVITVGQMQKHTVEQIGALPAGRVHCINMGVWLPETILKSNARAQLGLAPDGQIVIFIGNLLHCKGPDILIRAAAQLWREDKSFLLFIGGQGVEAHNLRCLAAELQALNHVTMLGAVPAEAVPMWFAAADVCVVPSRTESFGLVAVEAMACGTPVIAADIGGLRETITHGENGFLFPAGDSIALAEQLRQVLSDDALRGSVVEAGRRTAAAHDMRLKAAQVKQIYEQLLNLRSREG